MNRSIDFQPPQFLYQTTARGWWVRERTERFIQQGQRRHYEYALRGFIPRSILRDLFSRQVNGQSRNQKKNTSSPLSSKSVSQNPSPSISSYNLQTGQRKLVIKEEYTETT